MKNIIFQQHTKEESGSPGNEESRGAGIVEPRSREEKVVAIYGTFFRMNQTLQLIRIQATFLPTAHEVRLSHTYTTYNKLRGECFAPHAVTIPEEANGILK